MPDRPEPPTHSLPEHIRLVVLFGGRSAEHDISCITASHVLAAADKDRYELVPVGIDRDGRWLQDPDTTRELLRVGTAPLELHAAGTEVAPTSVILPPGGASDASPTVVLPLLHGPFGEDGTVQGFLELAGVPYVGSGVLGSALCMDKAMAKMVAGAAGIAQCAWLGFDSTASRSSIAKRVEAELGYPCFVKPANLGSSVGISKATDASTLATALDLAFTYDEHIVVEEAVVAREIEVAVLGSSLLADGLRASVPGEIVPTHDFYDYQDKYDDGAAQLCIPAGLDARETDRVRDLALQAFRELRCEGMARVDFFYEADGRGWLLNEVNTIPGFTPLSMYPKLFEASGIPYSNLVDQLVALALARHERRAHLSSQR